VYYDNYLSLQEVGNCIIKFLFRKNFRYVKIKHINKTELSYNYTKVLIVRSYFTIHDDIKAIISWLLLYGSDSRSVCAWFPAPKLQHRLKLQDFENKGSNIYIGRETSYLQEYLISTHLPNAGTLTANEILKYHPKRRGPKFLPTVLRPKLPT
jgi:hypothetical protein